MKKNATIKERKRMKAGGAGHERGITGRTDGRKQNATVKERKN